MRSVAVLLLLICSACCAFAQPASSRSELERRRQSILESIRQSQQELAATKKNKNATLSQLRALQNKLDARMRLIGNINQEISSISGTIQTSSQEVGQLRENLGLLKNRYAQSLRYAYANRSSYNMLAFLFSATNYNDAVRRLKYLKRYRDYRKQQAEEIRTTQARIENKITLLNTQKVQKNLLLTAEEQQRLVLVQETNETNHVVRELKGRESQLIADIEKNRRAAKQVERSVNALIAREIEEQRRRAQEEARRRQEEESRKLAAANAARANANNGGYGSGTGRVNLNTGSGIRPGTAPSAGSSSPANRPVASSSPGVTATLPSNRPVRTATARELAMTPDAIALSNNFAANRGRLPWPVERGTITGFFGPHKHPIANVIIENNGIDIQTNPGASARAVFDGTVTAVFSIMGSGQNVMIAHGDFFTVYTNLASTSVRKGDQVHTKQPIGVVGLNEEGLPTMNFQIWKSKTKQNPAAWIAQ